MFAGRNRHDHEPQRYTIHGSKVHANNIFRDFRSCHISLPVFPHDDRKPLHLVSRNLYLKHHVTKSFDDYGLTL